MGVLSLQMTPDSHFVLDQHPAHKNIVIGAGFSGTNGLVSGISPEQNHSVALLPLASCLAALN